MRKKIKPSFAAGSKFNRNEVFGLKNIPKHFESVTDEEISRIKTSVIEEVSEASHFKPGALQDVLKSVDGHFESAYSTLEGDYGTRRSNLNEVYRKSMTDLQRACDTFALQAAEYNILLEKYSEANEIINGKQLPKNLAITDGDIAEIRQLIEKLSEKRG